MKELIKTAIFLMLLTNIFSCGSDQPNNDTTDSTEERKLDYGAIAQDLCACMQGMMDIQKEILKLSNEGKTEEIQTLLESGKLQDATDEGEKCIGGMEEKYGALQEDEEKMANTAFKEACPEIAQMLTESENSEE